MSPPRSAGRRARPPQYIQVLLKQQLVDTASVLVILYKYSTLHTQLHAGGDEQVGDKKGKIVRWRNSYASEEILFWILAKALSQGIGVKSVKDAIDVTRISVKWLNLYTDAATAFSRDAYGAIHSLQVKDEIESSRTAFTSLFLHVCGNHHALALLGSTDTRAKSMHASFSSPCSTSQLT
jgi:mediator of RNA polymerase II transcription subunit 5